MSSALMALLLLQHARAAARLGADQAIVLLEDQDRRLWDRNFIAEGLVLVDKALRHQQQLARHRGACRLADS
jgi:RNA polymerase sigma-70 factor, ECF subfamily